MKMNIQEFISDLNSKTSSDFHLVDRLLGGKSNYTYIIKNPQEELFTMRIPGDYADLFIDHQNERKNLKEVISLGIAPKTVFFDESYKVSQYITGESFTSDISDEEMSKIVSILKKLHSSKIKFDNSYEHLQILAKYKKLRDQKHYLLSPNFEKRYLVYYSQWEALYNELLQNFTPVPCHNDAQLANFIHDTTGNIILIDWEFSGMNDYYYDLACLGNSGISLAEKALNIYHEDAVTPDQYKKLYAWRIFQCLQWYNVAVIKDFLGLSEKLQVPFQDVAIYFLDEIDVLFTKIDAIET